MKSSTELFKKLEELGLYMLRDDCAIVEEMAKEEVKTASGLVLPDAKRSLDNYSSDRMPCVRVLQVGKGYLDEEGAERPLDFQVGDILYIGPLATVKWFTDFLGMVSNTADRRIGIMLGYEENAFLKFDSEEKYRQALQVVAENK